MNRPAVFLDRDGTIVKYKGFITDESQLELEAGAAEGIKILNKFGFAVIVVTNQPQVARGLCTEGDIERIHRKMIELLAKEGARIDAVYYCPHHPEKNHSDIPAAAMKYRIDCECRKPNPGMLVRAAAEHGIDLSRSYLIGDSTVDLEAGRRAGVKTVLVKTGQAGGDGKFPGRADWEADNLEEAARIVAMAGVKAVILAGGRGERLRPLTDTLPKPMVEIAGKPVLEHQIAALRRAGIRRIVILGSYLLEKIQEHFGAGERFGVVIEYPAEPERLGTGGTIKNSAPFLREAEKIVILNGDKMIGPEFDVFEVCRFDAQQGGFCTLLVRETDHPQDSDVLELDERGRVVRFIGRGQQEKRIANSGFFIVNPALLDHIPEGESNLEKDVIFKLIGKKDLFAFMAPEHWFIRDIGTPERLASARQRFNQGPAPRVSVLLPTYNGGRFIERAIVSVLAQEYRDFELLVIDDGSTDDTAAIVSRLAAGDSRIRYLKNESNLGIQKTLNRGLREARGEHIARIDDDDEWIIADKLARQAAFLESHPDHVLIGTGAAIADELGAELFRFSGPLEDADIRRRILSRNCFSHSAVLFRKEAAMRFGGYDEGGPARHIEDYDLWLKLGTVGKFANLPVCAVRLTVRPGAISGANKRVQLARQFRIISHFKKSYPGYGSARLRSGARLAAFTLFGWALTGRLRILAMRLAKRS